MNNEIITKNIEFNSLTPEILSKFLKMIIKKWEDKVSLNIKPEEKLSIFDSLDDKDSPVDIDGIEYIDILIESVGYIKIDFLKEEFIFKSHNRSDIDLITKQWGNAKNPG